MTAVSLSSGPRGGGTIVTITGTNFTGATAVTFGGTAARSFTVTSANSITAVTPPHLAGTVDVAVTTPSGTGTGRGAFTYLIALIRSAPGVITVSPNFGPTNGGTPVTITGFDFTGATEVTFGGQAASNVVVVDATTITATTPAHGRAEKVDVTVTTSNGTGVGDGLFTYVPPGLLPQVTSVSPNTGPTTGGTSVTISGRHLGTTTSVRFGGVEAVFTQLDSTSIIATTPAHAAGTVDIVVTTLLGTAVGASLFTYEAVTPTVTSVSPNIGPTAGGTSVTITGTNFTGATAVTFGGTAATSFTVNSATSITAVTPEHAAGAVDVRVTTPGGTGVGGGLFTYLGAYGHVDLAEQWADGRRYQRHHHRHQLHRRHGGNLRRDRGHKLHCEQCNLDHRDHAGACGRCSRCGGEHTRRHWQQAAASSPTSPRRRLRS